MAENRLVISEKERPLFYGAFNNDVNTIGGFANWVQDWEYRECPECGRKMKYLAQIHWDTIEDCAEGTLFIEICPDCKSSNSINIIIECSIKKWSFFF